MQWLNKLDDVLDQGLTSRTPAETRSDVAPPNPSTTRGLDDNDEEELFLEDAVTFVSVPVTIPRFVPGSSSTSVGEDHSSLDSSHTQPPPSSTHTTYYTPVRVPGRLQRTPRATKMTTTSTPIRSRPHSVRRRRPADSSTIDGSAASEPTDPLSLDPCTAVGRSRDDGAEQHPAVSTDEHHDDDEKPPCRETTNQQSAVPIALFPDERTTSTTTNSSNTRLAPVVSNGPATDFSQYHPGPRLLLHDCVEENGSVPALSNGIHHDGERFVTSTKFAPESVFLATDEPEMEQGGAVSTSSERSASFREDTEHTNRVASTHSSSTVHVPSTTDTTSEIAPSSQQGSTFPPAEYDNDEQSDTFDSEHCSLETVPESRDGALADDSIRKDDDSGPPTFPHRNGVPRQVELRSEFEVGRHLVSWVDEDDFGPWDFRMNRKGVVHVRLLRAQRLPCSVGSSVQAVLSLTPWKGKVRTDSTRAFSGPSDHHGVCVQWDEDETKPTSMVHAYSSADSPIPFVHIDLVFSTLGMFDFTMCSLEVSCESLLRSPRVAKRQWFLTTIGDHEDHAPLMQMEAMFEPAEPLLLSSPLDTIENVANTRGSVDASMTIGDTREGNAALPSAEPSAPHPQDDRSQAGFSVSHNSLQRREVHSLPHRSHLLSLKTFYTPAQCCVCHRSIMSGLTKHSAFHCEACNLDCCRDCQLQVDVECPCGSAIARKAVEKSIQNKLTTENLLNILAPKEDTLIKEGHRKNNLSFVAVEDSDRGGSLALDAEESHGIGRVRLHFLQATVLREPLPPTADVEDVTAEEMTRKTGDYYIRVATTESDLTKRTATVQNSGKPRFDKAEMQFNIHHYGTEFRIEIVNAETDRAVGSALVSTQILLQKQRDHNVEHHGLGLMSIHKGPPSFKGMLRWKIEIRTGRSKFAMPVTWADAKQGVRATTSSKAFRYDHFPLAPEQDHDGSIVGWVDLQSVVEENFQSLYGSNPQACPSRPQGDLNMNVLQLHFSRISFLLDDIKGVFDTCQYITSWESPLLTVLSLVSVIVYCVRFNPAYFGCTPISFLIIILVYLAMMRKRKESLKSSFIKRQQSARRKGEKVVVNYKIHRPFGMLQIKVDKGKNLLSPELGFSGNVGCRVYWDLARYASPKKATQLMKVDKSAAVTLDICTTDFVYMSNPIWERVVPGDICKRLKLALPTYGDAFDIRNNGESATVAIPILQPFTEIRKDLHRLDSWKSSCAGVVFEVKFTGPLPGSEFVLGEVCIPFARLIDSGEVVGWFQVGDVGTQGLPPEDFPEPTGKPNDHSPMIHIRILWSPPKTEFAGASETEREASLVIQEELMRSAVLVTEQRKTIASSSVGAFNSVRSISGSLLAVQTALGNILDTVEALKNLLTFSDPFKSSVLLLLLVLMWMLMAIVPTKFILLAAAITPYVTSFHARFVDGAQKIETFLSSSRTDNKHEMEAKPHSVLSWVVNAIRGLPTEEDLRMTYYWEARRVCFREFEMSAQTRRNLRLQRLWRAQWYSMLEIMTTTVESGASEIVWRTAFAVIHGHRLLWWKSAMAFDNGDAAEGQLFLQGHAGLATPTPLEMKAIKPEDSRRVISVFGKGAGKQERITVLAPTHKEKVKLEEVIGFAVAGKND